MSLSNSEGYPLQAKVLESIEVNGVNSHHTLDPPGVILSWPGPIKDYMMEKILGIERLLHTTRRELQLPEYNMASKYEVLEKQIQECDKKDSAVVLSENYSRKGSGEDEIARKTDDNIPDLNAVNIKLNASAELSTVVTTEPSKAAAMSILAPAKIQLLRSQLEGIPHAPNAPKIPSVGDLNGTSEANQASDAAPALISEAQDKRERDILKACVRADGLNHFISKEEVKVLKARGIDRLPVITLPDIVEKKGLMQKLKLWEKTTSPKVEKTTSDTAVTENKAKLSKKLRKGLRLHLALRSVLRSQAV